MVFMKKGVSPLIASVLLVVFTIAIGAMLLGFFSGTTERFSEDAESGREQVSECTYKSVKISDVFINTTSQIVRATITNDGTGDSTLKVAAVYNINGERCYFDVADQVLSEGDIKLYSNTTDCNIFAPQCSDFAYAEVTTSCGNAFDTFRTNPSCSA